MVRRVTGKGDVSASHQPSRQDNEAFRAAALCALPVGPKTMRIGAGRGASAIATVVAGDGITKKGASALLVAVTTRVPADAALSAPPDTEQPCAAPFTTVIDTVPTPEPPLVTSFSGVPTRPNRDERKSGA